MIFGLILELVVALLESIHVTNLHHRAQEVQTSLTAQTPPDDDSCNSEHDGNLHTTHSNPATVNSCPDSDNHDTADQPRADSDSANPQPDNPATRISSGSNAHGISSSDNHSQMPSPSPGNLESDDQDNDTTAANPPAVVAMQVEDTPELRRRRKWSPRLWKENAKRLSVALNPRNLVKQLWQDMVMFWTNRSTMEIFDFCMFVFYSYTTCVVFGCVLMFGAKEKLSPFLVTYFMFTIVSILASCLIAKQRWEVPVSGFRFFIVVCFVSWLTTSFVTFVEK